MLELTENEKQIIHDLIDNVKTVQYIWYEKNGRTVLLPKQDDFSLITKGLLSVYSHYDNMLKNKN